jgi:hypothetical protein
VEGTFGVDSNASPLSWRIVWTGKPDPLFRTMRLSPEFVFEAHFSGAIVL